MTRSTQPSGCARSVRTLGATIRYADSGWTTAEWALIEDAMSRCTNPGPRDKPKRGRQTKPAAKGTYKTYYRCPICNGPHARKDCTTPQLF